MLHSAKPQKALTAFQSFLNAPLEGLLDPEPPEATAKAVLELFQDVVATVPAYRNFLQNQGVDPSTVQTLAEFESLPLITKDNYLRSHALADLCRHGQLESCDLIAVSSGSTGEPTFWPRFLSDELHIAVRFEQIFHDSFQADTRRTLAVVCFSLGTWVGGMFTANCCRHLAQKGYPITVVTPGNHQPEILRVVQALGPAFEQVVLLGYPPFLKDVVDRGLAQGLDWQQYRSKLVLAGEVVSEEWRTLMGERLGTQNPYYDSASLYGTADAGVLGNETPLSICIRRFLAAHPQAARQLFGQSRLPTLVQYDPRSRFFEVQDGTLLFSGDNGIPLIRYHIADNGGLISYADLLEFLKQWNFDPLATLQNQRGVHPLPFAYVFGRSQFTVSFFGANIYPENISVGLEQPQIQAWVTGKFVLQVKQDPDHNPYLSVMVELAPQVAADQEKKQAIAVSILTQLRRLNSEFANYVPVPYQQPQVELAATGDPEYFPVGVKHRYTRR